MSSKRLITHTLSIFSILVKYRFKTRKCCLYNKEVDLLETEEKDES